MGAAFCLAACGQAPRQGVGVASGVAACLSASEAGYADGLDGAGEGAARRQVCPGAWDPARYALGRRAGAYVARVEGGDLRTLNRASRHRAAPAAPSPVSCAPRNARNAGETNGVAPVACSAAPSAGAANPDFATGRADARAAARRRALQSEEIRLKALQRRVRVSPTPLPGRDRLLSRDLREIERRQAIERILQPPPRL